MLDLGFNGGVRRGRLYSAEGVLMHKITEKSFILYILNISYIQSIILNVLMLIKVNRIKS